MRVPIGTRELIGSLREGEQSWDAVATGAEVGRNARRPDAGCPQTQSCLFDEVAHWRHPLFAHGPNRGGWSIAQSLAEGRARVQCFAQDEEPWPWQSICQGDALLLLVEVGIGFKCGFRRGADLVRLLHAALAHDAFDARAADGDLRLASGLRA